MAIADVNEFLKDFDRLKEEAIQEREDAVYFLNQLEVYAKENFIHDDSEKEATPKSTAGVE
jgi:hypothetical protein